MAHAGRQGEAADHRWIAAPAAAWGASPPPDLSHVADAPWVGQRVPIEKLPAFKARWGLRTVGGGPDLDSEAWTPELYLLER